MMADDTKIKLGKHWAALRGERVIALLPMWVPADIDFDGYREKALECLRLLGEVKSGELIERSNGHRYFVQRLTHANRGKAPRKPKEFLINKSNHE